MFISDTRLRTVVVAAALALPVMVSAGECLTTEEATNTIEEDGETGYATQIQSDQGQGGINCSAFTGPGGAMYQIPVAQDKLKGPVSDPIKWSVTDPDPDINVDVVFIGNSDGSRCSQFYSGNARSGFAGAGTKRNKDATLVACSDGFVEPLPPEPPVPPTPPLTTIDGDCSSDPSTAAFQMAINDNPDYDYVIVGGRNDDSGGEGNTAICVDQQNGDGRMKRCVERCITPDADSPVAYAPNDPECLDPTAAIFPLKCRACELSSVVDSDLFEPDLPFCWEQAQKVDLDAETFRLPPPEQGEQGWTIKGRQGSRCYLISGQTQSGYRYSYWAPSGCPR